MSTLDSTGEMLLNESYPAGGQTGVASNESLATSLGDREERLRAWQRFIDEKLIEWGRDPGELEEAQLIPPTRRAIDKSVRLAMTLRDRGFPPASRVVPDGDGGIVFERWEGSVSETFEVSANGTIEYVQCRDCTVKARHAIQ